MTLTPNNTQAEQTAEELLATTGESLLSGDLARFRSCFELPFQLETVTGLRSVTTEAEFSDLFDSVRCYMTETGVIDFVRTVISASFRDPETISSIHLASEIHKGGCLNRPAYPVRSKIQKLGGCWKITSCLYVITDNAVHNAALIGDACVTDGSVA